MRLNNIRFGALLASTKLPGLSGNPTVAVSWL
jgi:hypothetical protein